MQSVAFYGLFAQNNLWMLFINFDHSNSDSAGLHSWFKHNHSKFQVSDDGFKSSVLLDLKDQYYVLCYLHYNSLL